MLATRSPSRPGRPWPSDEQDLCPAPTRTFRSPLSRSTLRFCLLLLLFPLSLLAAKPTYQSRLNQLVSSLSGARMDRSVKAIAWGTFAYQDSQTRPGWCDTLESDFKGM